MSRTGKLVILGVVVGLVAPDTGKSLGIRAFDRLAGKRRDLRHGHFSQRSSHKTHPSTNQHRLACISAGPNRHFFKT